MTQNIHHISDNQKMSPLDNDPFPNYLNYYQKIELSNEIWSATSIGLLG